MRTAFIEALEAAAETDERILLLTGDLGYSVVERFQTRFPRRFINVGVAEQNMVGIAAGLAMTGKIVFTYSIANFPSLRCLEQIRNDVCYPKLPVISVSVGGGLAYGSAGYSHHAIEDLSIMRSLPNLSLVAPADGTETQSAVRSLIELSGPGYLRLGKTELATSFAKEGAAWPNHFNVVRQGRDLTFLTTGDVLGLALDAADQLSEMGIEAEILTLPFVSPLADEAVARLALRTGKIVTVEENVSGGLGGAIAEKLCNSGIPARLATVTLRPTTDGLVGTQDFLRQKGGLTAEALKEAATRLLFKPAVALAA